MRYVLSIVALLVLSIPVSAQGPEEAAAARAAAVAARDVNYESMYDQMLAAYEGELYVGTAYTDVIEFVAAHQVQWQQEAPGQDLTQHPDYIAVVEAVEWMLDFVDKACDAASDAEEVQADGNTFIEAGDIRSEVPDWYGAILYYESAIPDFVEAKTLWEESTFNWNGAKSEALWLLDFMANYGS